jgi:regulator of sigma E protease
MMIMSGAACQLLAATWIEWFAEPANWWIVLQVAGGLGFVIFVHELGHFLVAKACCVKCEKFFLGFDIGGLKLLSFRYGETEYGIGALPLGGYVKMLGQDDNPAAATAEAHRARASAGPGHPLTAGDLPPEPVGGPHPAWDPRSYPAQSVPERMAIISAGVIMNVIFAVLMASWAFGLGVREMTCMISTVRPGGAAWRAGLRTGDEIVAIGDRKEPIFSDLLHGVTVGSVKDGIDFTVRRPADAAERVVRLRPDTDLGKPTIGVTSPFSTTLPTDISAGLVGAAGAAAPAFTGGDTITAVDGGPVGSYAELIAALAKKSDQPVTLTVSRKSGAGDAAAETVSITLPPQPQRVTGLTMTPLPIKAVQEGSPAAAAGIEPGDRILAIDGEPVGDPLSLDDRLRRRVGEKLTLSLGREGGADRTVEVRPREVTWRDDVTTGLGCPVSIASLGLAIPVDALVAAVAADGPAGRAGILPGDRITEARLVSPDEKDPDKSPKVKFTPAEPNWPAVVGILQQLPVGATLRLDVETPGQAARTVDLAPVDSVEQFVVDRSLVFEPVYRMVRADSVAAALGRGFRKTKEDLSLVYGFLGKLWNRQISARLLGGPIEIAKQAGRSASEGFSRLLLFLTMLSANLAVVNFLPIPVLDGGHMVFLAYEFVRGKPPSEGVVAVLSYLGLALILTLMVFVFGLDLGLIPRR